MMATLRVLSLVSCVSALNIVSHGGSVPRKTAKAAAPVAMPADKMAEVFHRFDSDGNGWLDESELHAAFVAIGQPVGEDTIKHSFSLLDTNKDGKIDLDEFKAMAAQNVMPGMAKIFMQDNDHAFEANDEPLYDYARRVRDEKLAQEDTRRFCLDRCLSTGYCDVLEDLLDMTTAQVQKFCDSCSNDDECQLEYA